MGNDLSFISAASLSLEALAELYTRAFDDYFYPASVTAAELAARVPSEQLLLDRSPLLCVGGEPVGLALLGQRGERACCGGFGIVPAQRGCGMALPLAIALLEQARQNGAREMRLIVLAQNERAIKTYRRAGFTTWRELWCYEWAPGSAAIQPADDELVPASPHDLYELGAAWQPVAPIWSRETATLRALDGLSGLALIDREALVGYLVVQHAPEQAADIRAIGAPTPEDAVRVLRSLQRQYNRITCLNEPADSPAAVAMEALGFARAFRRFEMVIRL